LKVPVLILRNDTPCAADLEATAMWRIPGFLRDYLIYGIG
jgi:hypothetical protein